MTNASKNSTRNKILFGLAIVYSLFLLWVGRCNGIRSVIKNTGIDTGVHKDSVVIRYKPSPYKVIERDTQWLPGKRIPYPVHDTTPGVYEVKIDPADTAAILARYYERAFYDTTFKLKRGTLTMKAAVSENRLQDVSLEAFNTDTTIREKTVLRPPRNFVVSLKVSAIGDYKDPVFAPGAGLNFKFPNDQAIDIGVYRMPVDNTHRPMAVVSYSRPIKIRIFSKRKK